MGLFFYVFFSVIHSIQMQKAMNNQTFELIISALIKIFGIYR